jgi:3-oxoacyl-[acyl-carrier protein] reductase/meso-butanediol dehydrogenase/(S,S)-butanediol dehydrogenase/diacetyl reductase
MGTLSGKVAMVTGCGGERGVGRAIARRLAADGADLVLTDVAPAGMRVVASKPVSQWGGLEAVAAEIRAAGQRAVTALVDIRSSRQIHDVIAKAVETYGRIDILVNNAAAPPGADRVPVVELSEEAWDSVLNVNLKGTFLVSKTVATEMLHQKIRGRIINIASDKAKVGSANLAAYCASKFGLVGFTQALAMELAPAGITVNAICPGGIDTERVDYFGRREDGSYDEAKRIERIRQLGAAVPLGRLTTPQDVAEVAAFLASDAAGYITGQAINVSGGTIMH